MINIEYVSYMDELAYTYKLVEEQDLMGKVDNAFKK